MSSSKQREKIFHDVAFSDNTRSVTDKYYSIFSIVQQYYNKKLFEAAIGEKRVLEIGCGQGSATPFLAKHGISVIGIDISDVAVTQSRSMASQLGYSELLSFEVMDAENLQFPDSSFDLVCGSGILHHLDLDRVYSEISRVLVRDGKAVFIEPLGHNPLINAYRFLTPKLRTEDEHPLLSKDFDKARRVFSSVQTRYFHLTTLACIPFRKFSFFPSLLNTFDAVDAAIFKLIPPAGLLAWSVVLELRP